MESVGIGLVEIVVTLLGCLVAIISTCVLGFTLGWLIEKVMAWLVKGE